MEIKPQRIDDLSEEMYQRIMTRSMEDITEVYEDIRKILEDVRARGDSSLLEASVEFKSDVVESDLEVKDQEIRNAYEELDSKVIEGLEKAARNIKKFHEAQMDRKSMWSMEIREGVIAGRMSCPVEHVGCYIPGGRAAYPSTTLMTILPAKIAGVDEIIATTPPGPGMNVSPATLVAADIAGCDRIFKAGGPWGIAAMAYGTDTIPSVDKIVGPGNKYVTAAKMLVFGLVDIDSPAGPSETLILADDSGKPGLIALDLLSQAEHDPDSAAVLVTTSDSIALSVCEIINREFETLPRKEILESSMKGHSQILIASDMEEGIRFSNAYAPEHLQIITQDPFLILNRIKHAGSIFLGPNSPVPAGDYASGTNHVLPTGKCARMFSGLSVDDFVKKPTFQHLSKEGLAALRDTIVVLAEAEGLPIHARAVKARFD